MPTRIFSFFKKVLEAAAPVAGILAVVVGILTWFVVPPIHLRETRLELCLKPTDNPALPCIPPHRTSGQEFRIWVDRTKAEYVRAYAVGSSRLHLVWDQPPAGPRTFIVPDAASVFVMDQNSPSGAESFIVLTSPNPLNGFDGIQTKNDLERKIKETGAVDTKAVFDREQIYVARSWPYLGSGILAARFEITHSNP